MTNNQIYYNNELPVSHCWLNLAIYHHSWQLAECISHCWAGQSPWHCTASKNISKLKNKNFIPSQQNCHQSTISDSAITQTQPQTDARWATCLRLRKSESTAMQNTVQWSVSCTNAELNAKCYKWQRVYCQSAMLTTDIPAWLKSKL